jgi:hypothetical protein
MNVVFETPPRNHGQTVSVSYAATDDMVIRRTRDASDGRTLYDVSKRSGSDEGDYQNGAPTNERWHEATAADIQRYELD